MSELPDRLRAACGVLLAGGQSRRMGTPKISLALPDGRTLGEVVAGSLRETCGSVVISGAPDAIPDSLRQLPIVADEHHGLGPLGGIASVLASGRAREYVFVPCDMPAVTATLLERLFEATTGSAGAFSREGASRVEPFPVLLPESLSDAASEAVRERRLRTQEWIASIDPHRVVLAGNEAISLRNVNTPSELEDFTKNR